MFKIDQGQLFIFRLWIQWISSVVLAFFAGFAALRASAGSVFRTSTSPNDLVGLGAFPARRRCRLGDIANPRYSEHYARIMCRNISAITVTKDASGMPALTASMIIE
jgi:hypothetical protein